jgi:hypothetical protein
LTKISFIRWAIINPYNVQYALYSLRKCNEAKLAWFVGGLIAQIALTVKKYSFQTKINPINEEFATHAP